MGTRHLRNAPTHSIMIDYSQALLHSLAIHGVGNSHREEGNTVSNRLAKPSAEVEALLMQYFLRPFMKPLEVHQFVLDEDSPELNAVYRQACKIFDTPEDMLGQSVNMLNHLYKQSEHPHIKVGELFVVHFTTMGFEDEVLDAVGIFKAETKTPFFKFVTPTDDGATGLELVDDLGVNALKLDKGCIIMNTDRETGFRVLTVDANNYDADYWKRNFLNITRCNDHHFQTKNHIEMVKEFSKDVLAPNNRTEQIAFVNESVQYMADNEAWDNDDFGVTVLRNADLQHAFNDYRQQFSQKTGVALEDSFDISVPEVQQQKRKYKNQIDLDTQIQIRLPFSPDGRQPHIERGYDEVRGMFFYKVFFMKEFE